MGAAASSSNLKGFIVPIAMAVIALGSAEFVFCHVSAAKLRSKDAYRKEKLALKREKLEMIKDTKKSVTTGVTDLWRLFIDKEKTEPGIALGSLPFWILSSICAFFLW